MNSETERRTNNKENALRLLKLRGSDVVSNGDLLSAAGFRYGARLFELRRDGWLIETIRGEAGNCRFILKGHRVEQQRLFA